jgi:hypothetical protein
MKQQQTLFALVLLSLCSFVFPQTIIPVVQSSSYQIAPFNDSGIAGRVYLADYNMGSTLVVVNVSTTDANLSYPARIQRGSCGSAGDMAVPLENVNGARGLSITMTDAAYGDIAAGDYYVSVHHPVDVAYILACGEVGAAAQTATTQTTTTEPSTTPETIDQTGLAQGSELPTGVKPEEFATQMRTEGYGIYAVNGSSISGQIQVAEKAESGSTIVVTLSNVQSGQSYGLEIFQGDCGPDRASLVMLNPVPSVPSDPNASWTETSLSYSELAEGNNFVYVYAPDGAVIACGEVGAGALSQ